MSGPLAWVTTAAQVGGVAFNEQLSRLSMGGRDLIARQLPAGVSEANDDDSHATCYWMDIQQFEGAGIMAVGNGSRGFR